MAAAALNQGWEKLTDAWGKATSEQKIGVAAAAATVTAALGYYLLSGSGPTRVVANGKYKGVPLPTGAYDAAIVGGGPSGSVMASYATKAREPSGGTGRRGCV